MDNRPDPVRRRPLSAGEPWFRPRGWTTLWKAGMDAKGRESLNESLSGVVKERLTLPAVPDRTGV